MNTPAFLKGYMVGLASEYVASCFATLFRLFILSAVLFLLIE